MTTPTTDGRKGLRISGNHPLIADLEALRQKHDLLGCVLLGIGGPPAYRASTTAVGVGPLEPAMKSVADQVLARFDDGEFDSALEQTRFL